MHSPQYFRPVLLLALLGVLALETPRVHSATRYVATSGGNDGWNCTETVDNPDKAYRTARRGIACTQAGDTLMFRAGTYENDLCVSPNNPPGGPSPSARTRIVGAPGEVVEFRYSDHGVCGGNPYIVGDIRNMEFDNITLNGVDGYQRCVGMDGARGPGGNAGGENITFKHMEIKHCSQGIQGGFSNIFIYKVHAHHQCYNERLTVSCHAAAGDTEGHGLYITAHDSVVEDVQVRNNHGLGITFSCEGRCGPNVYNNVIRNSVIAYNGGLGVFKLPNNNRLYNSLLVGNGGGVLAGGDVVNNTIYANNAHRQSNAGIYYDRRNLLIRNNIVLGHDGGDITDRYAGGSCTNADHNICHGPNCDLHGTTAIFADLAHGDFRPAHGSVASVNAGNNDVPGALPAMDVSGNTRRVMDARIDVGAYEFAAAVAVGPAAYLQWQRSPATTVAGQVMTPPVQVRVIDTAFQLVSTSTAPITVALASAPSGATLSGTLTKEAVQGVATFADLTIDKAGTTYKLAATTPGLVGDTSNPFTITAAPIGVGPTPPQVLPPPLPGQCRMTMPDAKTTVTTCTLP